MASKKVNNKNTLGKIKWNESAFKGITLYVFPVFAVMYVNLRPILAIFLKINTLEKCGNTQLYLNQFSYIFLLTRSKRNSYIFFINMCSWQPQCCCHSDVRKQKSTGQIMAGGSRPLTTGNLLVIQDITAFLTLLARYMLCLGSVSTTCN